jgi:hypothetical protein
LAITAKINTPLSCKPQTRYKIHTNIKITETRSHRQIKKQKNSLHIIPLFSLWNANKWSLRETDGVPSQFSIGV